MDQFLYRELETILKKDSRLYTKSYGICWISLHKEQKSVISTTTLTYDKHIDKSEHQKADKLHPVTLMPAEFQK